MVWQHTGTELPGALLARHASTHSAHSVQWSHRQSYRRLWLNPLQGSPWCSHAVDTSTTAWQVSTSTLSYFLWTYAGVKLGRSPPEPGSPTYDLGSTTCNRSSTTSKYGSGT